MPNPNPTTAAEWAEKCNQDYLTSMRVEGRSNGHLRHGLCLACADAYARQRVEAFRERAAQGCDEDADALEHSGFKEPVVLAFRARAAAIRALSVDG